MEEENVKDEEIHDEETPDAADEKADEKETNEDDKNLDEQNADEEAGENVEKGEGDNMSEEYVGNEQGELDTKAEELGGEEHIGEEQIGEELEGEQVEGEEKEEQKKEEEKAVEEEKVEEEEQYVEEPPPDPAAPYGLSDSTEAIKPPFELRPDQTAEVEQLWELFQNYTPAYTDINGYITETELVYMLKALILLTYTPEQLQELIAYCVRPPHPQGHINYEQFLKMVTIRQREFPIEDELRSALQVLDPSKSGTIDREYMKELLAKQGHKMPQKQLDNLMKEVDISNDGTIGIEDVVGTMCIDLNKEDLIMLRASLMPPEEQPVEEEP